MYRTPPENNRATRSSHPERAHMELHNGAAVPIQDDALNSTQEQAFDAPEGAVGGVGVPSSIVDTEAMDFHGPHMDRGRAPLSSSQHGASIRQRASSTSGRVNQSTRSNVNPQRANAQARSGLDFDQDELRHLSIGVPDG